MTRQTTIRTLCLAGWVLACPGALAEVPAGHGGLSTVVPISQSGKQNPQDLTTLSLEQLLDLELTPINVLGSHTHVAGQWMAGYRYMAARMAGYRDGTGTLSDAQVLRQFPTIHTEMRMAMHMLELMHAPTESLTLMAMLPYHHMEMEHLTRTGARFQTESDGVGDLTLMALQTVRGSAHHHGSRLLVNAGVSVPFGSIDQHDATPTNPRAKLEYLMQPGSGTWELLPGVTYLGDSPHWSWGAQAMGTLRLGHNDNGYRRGNQIRLSAWAVRRITDWFAPSVRLDGQILGNVHGIDTELNPLGNPESSTRTQGGRKLDLSAGLNFYAPRGRLKGHRLSLEAGIPVYQHLNGPQIESDWQATLSWSYTFVK